MELNREKEEELKAKCQKFRQDVMTTLYQVQTGHPGGSLSVCEILTVIYEWVNIDINNPKKQDRDRVVLGKGHAAPMLYRVLADKGFFPVEEMKTLRQMNTRLQGHPCSQHTPGVDATTGPLGIGLSTGLGMAIAQQMNNLDARTFVVLGDGEINEGTVWEAAMAAVKFHASNLIAVLDRNHVQLDGTSDDIMPLLSISEKFKSFGWHVIHCDGHSIRELWNALEKAYTHKSLPTIIIAETVKGKGVSFMEGKNAWHGKVINENEYKLAMKELEVMI